MSHDSHLVLSHKKICGCVLSGDGGHNYFTCYSILGGIVTYQSPILLKGAHDKVMVHLVDTSPIQNHADDLEELKISGANAKLNIAQSRLSSNLSGGKRNRGVRLTTWKKGRTPLH